MRSSFAAECALKASHVKDLRPDLKAADAFASAAFSLTGNPVGGGLYEGCVESQPPPAQAPLLADSVRCVRSLLHLKL